MISNTSQIGRDALRRLTGQGTGRGAAGGMRLGGNYQAIPLGGSARVRRQPAVQQTGAAPQGVPLRTPSRLGAGFQNSTLRPQRVRPNYMDAYDRANRLQQAQMVDRDAYMTDQVLQAQVDDRRAFEAEQARRALEAERIQRILRRAQLYQPRSGGGADWVPYTN